MKWANIEPKSEIRHHNMCCLQPPVSRFTHTHHGQRKEQQKTGHGATASQAIERAKALCCNEKRFDEITDKWARAKPTKSIRITILKKLETKLGICVGRSLSSLAR